MKLNLSIFASFFLLLCTGLSAQNSALDLYLYNNSSIRIIENRLSYNLSPLKYTTIKLEGSTQNETRLNFNQNTRLADMEFDLGYERGILTHSLLSGFNYHYDKNDLESALSAYQSRMGFLGYGLQLNPLDSLFLSINAKTFLKTEQDRFLPETNLKGEGQQITGQSSFSYYSTTGFYGLSGRGDYLNLDWEHYESYGLNAYANQDLWGTELAASFSLDSRRDILYNLEQNDDPGLPSSYVETDKQKRWSIISDTRLNIFPTQDIELSIGNNFSQRKTRLEQNLSRNNADFINQASVAVNYSPLPQLSWQTILGHNFAIKDFSFSNSNRHTELRNLGTNLLWEYSPGDTLSFGSSIDLQRTSYPKDDHRLDNDLRNISLRLGSKHYYKSRLRFSNRLLWSLRDDVYIDSLLSGNNTKVQSLSFLPEISLLIGDSIILKQNYQIRVDYTDYMYQIEDQNNELYRQFTARYNLIFDSFPFIARSGDNRWLELPYRSGDDNAFLLDGLLLYERSEYGYQEETQYIINSLTERFTAGLSLRQDIGSFYYLIQPRISWGTWKEYSAVFLAAFSFDDDSSLELSLNPIGELLDELDWRLNLNVNLRY